MIGVAAALVGTGGLVVVARTSLAATSGIAMAVVGLLVVGGFAGAARAARLLPGRGALALALVVRAALVVGAPVLSDDVYRYVHEGRAGRVELALPYAVAPRDLAHLPDDGVRARVNHPDVPAAYPPPSQLFFIAVTALTDPLGHPIAAMRGALTIVDVLTVLVLYARRRRAGRRAFVAYGLHPLPLIALGLGPHLDALGVLALTVALTTPAFLTTRALLRGVALGLAVGVKPFALVAAAALARPAPLAVGLVLGILGPALPYLVVRAPLLDGVFAYATRWRASPLLFPVFEAVFADGDEARRAAGRFAHLHLSGAPLGVVVEDGGTVRLALGALGPEPLRVLLDGAFAARVLAAAVFLAVVVVVVVARRRARLSEVEGVGAILVAFLFLTPTVHPWYFWWLVPLAALSRSRALAGLTLAAPALYAARVGELVTGAWDEPLWPRLVVVGALVSGLVQDARRRARRPAPPAPPPIGPA